MQLFGWIYRRIEPKVIKFSVSYYPKASEYDPEPSEEQKMFHDFCAHTGWKLACTSAQMQIFYNEEENPTPIETEPELEVEAIHASAKKGFISSYILLTVLALLQGALFVSSLLGAPIGVLSNPSRLMAGFSFLLLFILCVVELVCYFNWHSKAKKAAEHGEFLKVPSTSKFQRIILVAAFISLVYWVINFIVCGDNIQRWIGILMCIYIPAVFIIVNATKEFLKHRKAARGVNRTVTTLTSFLVSFALMGLIVFVTFYASSNGLLANKEEETYEHNGMTWIIHQDELPLTVEDFMEVDYDGYIKERSGNESLLLGQLEMKQRPRFDADDYTDIPQLEYTIVVVKIPALYDMCKERLIYEQEELYLIHELEYKQEDATPWGANEAYRLYDSNSGASNEYLLCYDDFLVEINFSWEPTVEQMAVVGEKLGRN
ncbi:MAG: DUF2812 domain-containing protein [Tyzzerella sp.]|nr:DUF2812 domain-containing protein [Tyzzerella sp.]